MKTSQRFNKLALLLGCFIFVFTSRETPGVDLKESKRLETLFAPVANHLANLDGRWLGHSKENIERLEKVLVKTTRMIMRDDFSPIFFTSGDANHFIELLYMHPNVESDTFSFIVPTRLAAVSGNHFERKIRDKEATIQLFVYWLNHHLFLTSEQMVQIHEIISRKTVSDMMITSNYLIYDVVEAMGILSLILPEQEISEVLSKKQKVVWEKLYNISKSSRKSNRFLSTFYNSMEKEIIRSFYKTELPRDEAQKALDAISTKRKAAFSENKTKKNLSLNQEQKAEIAQARAELLLSLISDNMDISLSNEFKEVINTYIEQNKPRTLSNFNKEMNDNYRAEMDKLRKLIREKKITRKEASEKSQILKQELRDKLSSQRKKTIEAPPGIESFPGFHELVQKKYGNEKMEELNSWLDARERLLHNVMKEVAIANLDTELILSGLQLSLIKNRAIQLPKLKSKYPSPNMMVSELAGLIKLTPLSNWQDQKFKSVGKLAPFSR